MIVAIALALDGTAGQGWGRAPRVAVADVEAGRIERWTEHDTRWDVLHDEGSEGSHHARIARFLADHAVAVVVAGHMGPPMVQMLGRMGIGVRLDRRADARAAAIAASRPATTNQVSDALTTQNEEPSHGDPAEAADDQGGSRDVHR